jgi:hypothetical protein
MTFEQEVARRNGCVNKRAYSKKGALTTANHRNRGLETEYRQRVHVAHRHVRAYQCDFCNYWHLTSSEERR